MTSSDALLAGPQFAELFSAVYLQFHRRDGKAPQLPGASRAVLQHLAGAGPLSIGELSFHLERAQSVTSEIVDHLSRDGLLERSRDPQDRRRVLVWLTDPGLAQLSRDREVLSSERLAVAMAAMTASERAALLRGMRALLRAAPAPPAATAPGARRAHPNRTRTTRTRTLRTRRRHE